MAQVTVTVPCVRIGDKRSGLDLTVIRDDVLRTNIVTGFEAWNEGQRALDVRINVGARQRTLSVNPGVRTPIDLGALTLDHDNLTVSVRS